MKIWFGLQYMVWVRQREISFFFSGINNSTIQYINNKINRVWGSTGSKCSNMSILKTNTNTTSKIARTSYSPSFGSNLLIFGFLEFVATYLLSRSLYSNRQVDTSLEE
jgi:hypothetical protein